MAAATATKMMPDGSRIPSLCPSPALYGVEHMSPRYASEPPPLTGQPVYTDVNGHPLDPQQQAATCLVVDPASQVVRQEMASTYQQQQQQQLQQHQ